MASIQQTIEVQVPIHTLYRQLTQFEDYPQFLENVERVEQRDLTHLHWTARNAGRSMEWDTEITEREEGRLIAWHNADGPGDAGRMEMQELGPGLSRLVFTLDEHGQSSGLVAGNTEEEMARHLNQDLRRLKELLESRGPQARAWRAETEPGNVDPHELDAQTQADLMNQARQVCPMPATPSRSGSPTAALEDEPNETGPAALGSSGASAVPHSSKAGGQGR